MPLRRLALSTVLPLGLAACAAMPPSGPHSSRPDIVLVLPFAVPDRVVALDPSFGFSLRRGAPGVPQRRRAASVGRAAAFQLSLALTERLRAFGFDTARSAAVNGDPDRKTLIVTGFFDRIDEGRRRRVGAGPSEVAARFQVEYQAPGVPPRQLMTERLDSAQAPPPGAAIPASARRVADVNADARRLGAMIADAIADLARRENWLGPAQ
ncbi:MAG: hypothetical protein JO305_05300 [Alphaproteobacteria bacterium]|nr:hypothetical protein [Alphaproteobacteria bacterium]